VHHALSRLVVSRSRTCQNMDAVDGARVVRRASGSRTVQLVTPAADAVVAGVAAEVAACVRHRPRSPTNAVRRAGPTLRPPAVIGACINDSADTPLAYSSVILGRPLQVTVRPMLRDFCPVSPVCPVCPVCL